ncbi:hypothetical protein M9458_028940, partial [Cirrhinus mrigala]
LTLPDGASLTDVYRAAGWATPIHSPDYNLCVEPVSAKSLEHKPFISALWFGVMLA